MPGRVQLKFEPYEHLFQHIKQADMRLYEALKKIMRLQEVTIEEVTNPVSPAPRVQQDKATFGLQKVFETGKWLTLPYICRWPGNFIDVTAKPRLDDPKPPTGSDAILDIYISRDDGNNWTSIFPSGLLLPQNNTTLVKYTVFAIPDIQIGNLLHIEATQIGSTFAGQNFEVVLRWQ